jgi:hypothetical protein
MGTVAPLKLMVSLARRILWIMTIIHILHRKCILVQRFNAQPHRLVIVMN